MNRNNIPLILMLTAGAVTCVITYIHRYEMHWKLFALLIVLLVFYGLGCVIKWTLDYFERQNQQAAQALEDPLIELVGADAEQDIQEDQEA